ncbi:MULTISPECIES: hypothetical protein [Bacteria]|uniref:hypothetical protein n=1 Tax=Bacteria TaxID=2 RepID=UPI003C7DC6FD
MSEPGGVVAAHVAGPMWTVGGIPLVVPAGLEAPALVLAQLGGVLTGGGPWPVEVRQGGMTIDLVVQVDGSVSAAQGAAVTPPVRSWLRPAGAVEVLAAAVPDPVTAVPQLELLSAHVVSGASTWARLLGVQEVSAETRSGLPLLVAARSTLAGVEAAKSYTSGASVVLVIADAPGKVPAPVARAIRVLEGAAPVVRVPWVPALRGMDSVPDVPVVKKAAARVAAAVEKNRRRQ